MAECRILTRPSMADGVPLKVITGYDWVWLWYLHPSLIAMRPFMVTKVRIGCGTSVHDWLWYFLPWLKVTFPSMTDCSTLNAILQAMNNCDIRMNGSDSSIHDWCGIIDWLWYHDWLWYRRQHSHALLLVTLPCIMFLSKQPVIPKTRFLLDFHFLCVSSGRGQRRTET